jgi:hypothetical protein
MHYVTPRSQWMQKQHFGVTCPGTLFMETILGPPEHDKGCVDILHLGGTEVHYVTHRSQWMQKHMFSITCPGTLFIETAPGPPEHEK